VKLKPAAVVADVDKDGGGSRDRDDVTVGTERCTEFRWVVTTPLCYR